MKILLISTGYPKIYPYFEKSITNAFKACNHSILKVDPEYTNDTIRQIERYNPDLVLTLVGFNLDQQMIHFLKKRKTILCIWLTEDPFYMDDTIKLIKDYDYVFTVDEGAYAFYKKQFPENSIFHLPLGTDPALYYPDSSQSEQAYDLCLIGYPYPERVELVHYLMSRLNYSLILVGPQWKKFEKYFRNKKKVVLINRWVEPTVVKDLFNKSKIILNPHRAHDFIKNKNKLGIESKSINNRTFDIAACRRFQLVPNKADLDQHFNLTNEIVSYNDHKDCLQLVEHFLNSDQERQFYSNNAYYRVIKNHTFTHRVQFIVKSLN